MTAVRYSRAGHALLAVALMLPAHAAPAAADEVDKTRRQHALSLIGEPKFGSDFKSFDWVSVEAPKGGLVRQAAIGTFDSFNQFTVKGNPAAGIGLVTEALMASSPDEPSTEYCLLCTWVSHPADYSSVTFGLRPEARFHDGKPITAEDVAFSLEALKKAHPRFGFYYKNVIKAEKTGEHEVTFRFDQKGNRELPQIVGQLPILPKHFWQGKDANGEPRDLSKTTLEPPLGSGPYKVGAFEAGRTVVYERIKDYWGKDLPVTKGQWNFDQIKYVYFRDRLPAFEAFKAGEIDEWRESSSKAWATGYDFEAVKRGLVKTEALPVQRVAPMQAFAFNLRRKQFQDARVRRAFNLAFNFEGANKNLFYDQYTRVGSYFDNSELKASGLPSGKELEVLETVRGQVPPEVFTTEWKNPVSATPADYRKNMGEAARLLAEAGWTVKNGALVNAAGEALTAEFLIVQPDFERVVLPYVEDLKKLGIKASVRIVDPPQYKQREDTFDFDIIVDTFAQSLSPGNEQRDFWGSAAAAHEGSRNTIGIKSPAIDKLIDRVVFAKSREELVAATRALDRVLLWNHFVVPQWHFPFERIATWDMFGRPQKLPSQAVSFLQVWWMDPARQKALAAARGK